MKEDCCNGRLTLLTPRMEAHCCLRTANDLKVLLRFPSFQVSLPARSVSPLNHHHRPPRRWLARLQDARASPLAPRPCRRRRPGILSSLSQEVATIMHVRHRRRLSHNRRPSNSRPPDCVCFCTESHILHLPRRLWMDTLPRKERSGRNGGLAGHWLFNRNTT